MCLSEVPSFIQSPDFPIDVALLSLSPPDKHGWCSLNASLTVSKAGANQAKKLIAEISPKFPRTHGNTFIHYSHLDYVYFNDRKLILFPKAVESDITKTIGKYIAELIPDEACLQMGIGAVPDAVLASLSNHKNLGVHTELFAEGVIDLIEKGVITNLKKASYEGQVLGNFVFGSDTLYKYIDDNPLFHFESAQVTNDPYLIAKNPKMISINSAMEVDLAGQVCADSIGPIQYSGVGGQLDFVRGASMSDGGRAIIALPSTANGGKMSRIVTELKKGASITSAYRYGATIVTEYGIADLWGKNMRQRAWALIEIAHPDFRASLADFADRIYGK
jgi:acyl-CoA hydrolase